MELYEAFRGTFAARHFTDDPVSDETVAHLLENTRIAPDRAPGAGLWPKLGG